MHPSEVGTLTSAAHGRATSAKRCARPAVSHAVAPQGPASACPWRALPPFARRPSGPAAWGSLPARTENSPPPPGATCRSAAPLPPSPSSVARRRGAWPVQVCGDRPLSPVRAGSQFRGGVGAQSGRTLFSRPRRARESGRGASALRSLLSLDEHPFSRSLFFHHSPVHLRTSTPLVS